MSKVGLEISILGNEHIGLETSIVGLEMSIVGLEMSIQCSPSLFCSDQKTVIFRS